MTDSSYKLKNMAKAAILSSAGFASGIHLAIFNPLGIQFIETIYWKFGTEAASAIGYINLTFALGFMLSMVTTAWICDKIGRINSQHLGNVLGILNSIIFLIENIYILYANRMLSGFVSGFLLASAAAFISETFKIDVIGFGGSLLFLFVITFQFLCFSLGIIFERKNLVKNWRWLLFLPIILYITRLILTLIFIRFRSPKYLFYKHNDEAKKRTEIAKTLKFVSKEENYESAASRLITRMKKESKKSKVSLWQLMVLKKYRIRFWAALTVNLVIQLSGVNFLIFFSTDFFDRVSRNGPLITFLLGACNTIFAIIGLNTINRLGRKYNLRIGLIMQISGLLFINIGIFSQLPIVIALSACLYMSGFSFGAGSTHMAISSELLPSNGTNFCFLTQWVLTLFIGGFLGVVAETIGPIPLMTVFAIFTILGFFFIEILFIETKGKSMEEIESDYSSFRIPCFRGSVAADEKNAGDVVVMQESEREKIGTE